MDLSKGLSYEAGVFSHHCHPHRFLQSKVLRLYFPMLEPWAVWSVSLPSCSWFIHTQMLDHLVLQPPPCHLSSLPQPPISVPPTCLNDCFFFNSLVVRLSYTSVFWQFCFFVCLFLNLLLSFFWLCEEAVYLLCLHLGWKSWFFNP